MTSYHGAPEVPCAHLETRRSQGTEPNEFQRDKHHANRAYQLAPVAYRRYISTRVAIAEEHNGGPSPPILDMPRDILVVDDDRDIRETLGEILLHEGYHVEM